MQEVLYNHGKRLNSEKAMRENLFVDEEVKSKPAINPVSKVLTQNIETSHEKLYEDYRDRSLRRIRLMNEKEKTELSHCKPEHIPANKSKSKNGALRNRTQKEFEAAWCDILGIDEDVN